MKMGDGIGCDEFENRDVIGILIRDMPGFVYGDTTIVGMRVPSPK